MKRLFKIAGVVLSVLGTIWVLQGINLLPGSFMSGQTQWAVRGAIAIVAGTSLLLLSHRMRIMRP